MNRFFRHFAVVFFLCNIAAAQTASTPSLSDLMAGQVEAEGIRVPYYDEEGNLKAMLYGWTAKVLENNVINISELRIDVYKDGKLDASVFAPQCLVHEVKRNEESILVAESAGEVLVELDGLTIVGKGFRFRSDQNRFEILNEAKVIVDESARESTELKL
ncbi:MAG: hypothetical protein JXR40_09570 [Pontiellaceae bacterium]|nr:hypothetical protein [Pontiellaceae bacterium]